MSDQITLIYPSQPGSNVSERIRRQKGKKIQYKTSKFNSSASVETGREPSKRPKTRN